MGELAAGMTADQHAHYDDLAAAMDKQSREQAGTGLDPSEAAKVIADAIQSSKPHARYLVGRDAKLLAAMTGPLTDHMVDSFVARSLRLRPISPETPGAARTAAAPRMTTEATRLRGKVALVAGPLAASGERSHCRWPTTVRASPSTTAADGGGRRHGVGPPGQWRRGEGDRRGSQPGRKRREAV